MSIAALRLACYVFETRLEVRRPAPARYFLIVETKLNDMQTSVKLYSLGYQEMRAYLWATLFVVGNVALPQLCHLMPQGGLIWLPIYFFTLVGAYKYGWKVGLLTAVLSPLANHVLFGMPPAAMLPGILVKSTLLAVIAAYVAHRTQRVSLLLLMGVVLGYQVVGCGMEALMHGSLYAGVQDFRLGLPGMLLQVLGGYWVIKHVLRS